MRRQRHLYAVPQECTVVHISGACKYNATGCPVVGGGIYFGYQDDRNQAVRPPTSARSSVAAEIYALSVALVETEPFVVLRVRSQSRMIVAGLTEHLSTWEDRGWLNVAHAELFKDAVARIRSRSAPTFFKLVDRRSSDDDMASAKALARRAVDEAPTPGLMLPPPLAGMLASGMKLCALSQKAAYRVILNGRSDFGRRATERNLAMVTDATATYAKQTLDAGQLWRSLYHKDLRRTMRDFWWTALHGALRVGTFWEKIPTLEHRASCSHCGVTEDLEHIWLRCDVPAWDTLWKLVSALLTKRGIGLPRLTFGVLLAAPALYAHNAANVRMKGKGATRLLRIALTETCHLIWKLRCERVIDRNGDPDHYHSMAEVCNRWFYAINKRLRLDQLLTRPALFFFFFNSGADIVLDTWRGTLEDELALPEDWTRCEGVLVGKLLPCAFLDTG
ncbi:ribonuclease H-like protein [Cubamyces sp. BRFM 1775]|nr:ribonuclease H-like protein [Cubamyces sp. BRFM 1775]